VARSIALGPCRAKTNATIRNGAGGMRRRLSHYEISNWAKPGFESKHNLNIGGGSHT